MLPVLRGRECSAGEKPGNRTRPATTRIAKRREEKPDTQPHQPHETADTPVRYRNTAIHIVNMSTISTMNHLGADVEDYPDDDIYADVDDHGEAPDHRWRPVAAIAAGVLVLAVIATALIVNGGDSTSTTATVGPQPTRSVIATPRPALPTAPPDTSLPLETVTTVSPPPTAKPTTAPSGQPTATAPQAAPSTPPPAVNPRTITYRVTGTKQILDFVSIVYTDAQGLPHTDFNVSLPWSKTLVLNPGVQLTSVVATSLGGHLNCMITNAEGQTVIASSNNAMIATCTR